MKSLCAKLVLILSLSFGSFLQAEIIEITQIKDVEEKITSNTLCLFDIDDTLIQNPFNLGRSAWRSWAKSVIPSNQFQFPLYDALTLYIAKKAPYIPVEESTAKLISDLQKKGIPVFAFTARGRSEWYTTELKGVDQFTHQQLIQAGINFKETQVPKELLSLEPTYFYDGIIFASHIKKGTLLKHLLKDLNYRPDQIIFIDDNLDQVQSVEIALRDSGIPFYGFWYKNPQPMLNPFAAAIQLEFLSHSNQILSDEEATEIAKTKQDLELKAYFIEIIDSIDPNELLPTIHEEKS